LYITVGTLLLAANQSLEDGGLTDLPGGSRRWGTELILRLHFTNIDDFWTWPWGLKPKFLLSPMPVRFTSEVEVQPGQFWRTSMADGTGSHNVVVRGTRLSWVVTSSLASFDFMTAVKRITVATIIIGFTKTVVSALLTRIYRLFPSTRHIGVLYTVSRYDHTMEDTEFAMTDGHSQVARSAILRRSGP